MGWEEKRLSRWLRADGIGNYTVDRWRYHREEQSDGTAKMPCQRSASSHIVGWADQLHKDKICLCHDPVSYSFPYAF